MSKIARKGSKQYRRSSSFLEIPYTKLNQRSSYDLIPIVRERFINLWNSDCELYDEIDVRKIQSNDWSVQRFIENNGNNIDEALQQLDETMRWRKSNGVNHRSLAKDSGREFFNIGALVQYNEDKNGLPVLYLRVKCNRKSPELRPVIEQFFVDIIEKLDTDATSRGFVLVMDFSDAGLKNVNLDLLKFMIATFRHHYPLGLRYTLNYNLPWILRGIWSLVNTWLGDYNKTVYFVDRNTIRDYIDTSKLPKHMGGSCDRRFARSPDGCPSVYDLGHRYGFTGEDVSNHMKVYADLLEEAKYL